MSKISKIGKTAEKTPETKDKDKTTGRGGRGQGRGRGGRGGNKRKTADGVPTGGTEGEAAPKKNKAESKADVIKALVGMQDEGEDAAMEDEDLQEG